MQNIELERNKLKKELLLSKNLYILEDKYTSRMTDKLLFNVDEDYRKTFALEKIFLSKIDFNDISFNDVDIRNIDFKNMHNVTIDLQKIYNKSLEGTTLNGVNIIGSYKDVVINRTDFTGALGNTFINPNEIHDKYLFFSKFYGITFTKPFNGCHISFCDFRGSNNAVINPQKQKKLPVDITNPKLCYIPLNNNIFSNVTFVGSFYGTDVRSSDFTNSNGNISLNNVFLINNNTRTNNNNKKK